MAVHVVSRTNRMTRSRDAVDNITAILSPDEAYTDTSIAWVPVTFYDSEQHRNSSFREIFSLRICIPFPKQCV